MPNTPTSVRADTLPTAPTAIASAATSPGGIAQVLVPGPSGAMGPQGPAGADGAQGPQGDVGPQGPAGTATPGGSDTSVQFNDAGTLSGTSNFTFTKDTSRVDIINGDTGVRIIPGTELAFYDLNGSLVLNEAAKRIQGDNFWSGSDGERNSSFLVGCDQGPDNQPRLEFNNPAGITRFLHTTSGSLLIESKGVSFTDGVDTFDLVHPASIESGSFSVVAGSGTRLVSFRSGTTERGWIDPTGNGVFTTSIASPLISTYSGGTAVILKGDALDNSGSIGAIIRSGNATLTSGSAQRLLSIRNANTEKAYVDANGTISGLTGSFEKIRLSGATADLYGDATYGIRTAYGRFDTALLAGGIQSNSYTNTNAGSTIGMQYRPLHTDGTASIVHKFDSAITVSTGKLLSVQNNASEKFYIDASGAIVSAGGFSSIPNLALTLLEGNPVRIRTYRAAPIQYEAGVVNGASSIAHKFGVQTPTALTGTAKIVSFYNDNLTTEKAYIDASGSFSGSSGTFSGVVSASGYQGLPITTLDQIGDPVADKTFTMANKNLKFAYTAPAGADGAFELEAIGGFTGDLLHVHQNTGNPGAGTDLIHAEFTDADVTGLRVSGPSPAARAAEVTGSVFVTGSVTVSGVFSASSYLGLPPAGTSIQFQDEHADVILGPTVVDFVGSGVTVTTTGTAATVTISAGAATPGGASGAVQWNDSGTLSGALLVRIEPVSGALALMDLESSASYPTPYASSSLLISRRRAGRQVPMWCPSDDKDATLQYAIWNNSFAAHFATPSAVAIAAMGSAVTLNVTGTATAAAISTANFTSSLRRVDAAGVATAGNGSGFFGGLSYWRGNGADLGGFFWVTRFILGAGPNVFRVFAGFTGTVTAPMQNIDPSSATNIIALAKDVADGNWQVMTNDNAGTASKINTGLSATFSTAYEVRIFAPSNGSVIGTFIKNLNTGASFDYQVTGSNIVSNSTLLSPRILLHNATAATATRIGFISSYIETDY